MAYRFFYKEMRKSFWSPYPPSPLPGRVCIEGRGLEWFWYELRLDISGYDAFDWPARLISFNCARRELAMLGGPAASHHRGQGTISLMGKLPRPARFNVPFRRSMMYRPAEDDDPARWSMMYRPAWSIMSRPGGQLWPGPAMLSAGPGPGSRSRPTDLNNGAV